MEKDREEIGIHDFTEFNQLVKYFGLRKMESYGICEKASIFDCKEFTFLENVEHILMSSQKH